MNQHQRKLIDLIVNNEEFRKHIKEESELTKRRVQERMNKQEVATYTKIGNEEQLERLDRMFVNGAIEEQEYAMIRARLRGDRNA